MSTPTTTPTSLAPAAAGGTTRAAPGVLRLVVLHSRLQVLETLRVPVAVIGTTLFPVLSYLFFVVPQPFADEVDAATGATAQLSVFAVASVCLFTFGAGVAEDRALPWDAYLRTLPAGPLPRFAGRLVAALVLAGLGLAPLLLLAATATAAELPVVRWPGAVAALVAAAVPLLGLGLAVGYSMSAKAAVAVAQVLLFPLAFGGGLFLPPEAFPSWLDAVSLGLPTRAGRDLVVWACVGEPLPVTTVPVLLTWQVVTLGAAAWAYRRDEGRRFR